MIAQRHSTARVQGKGLGVSGSQGLRVSGSQGLRVSGSQGLNLDVHGLRGQRW